MEGSSEREKALAKTELKRMQAQLERLVGRLSAVSALNEAAYLRKALVEIKRAERSL